MKIKELYEYIDALYPRTLSCDWDNDGLMCSADENAEIVKVLISLDATEEAVREAAKRKCNVLLTHHPLLFHPPNAVNNNDYLGRRIITSFCSKVSVMSFHTRLDSGEDGVNDRLVKALGFTSCGSFGDDESPTLGRIFELDNSIDAILFTSICKNKLGCSVVRITGDGSGKRICVVGGAGGDFIEPAIEMGADFLLTGECSYNKAQDAAENGLIVIEAGHYETEFPVCSRFKEICNDLGLLCEIFDSRVSKII